MQVARQAALAWHVMIMTLRLPEPAALPRKRALQVNRAENHVLLEALMPVAPQAVLAWHAMIMTLRLPELAAKPSLLQFRLLHPMRLGHLQSMLLIAYRQSLLHLRYLMRHFSHVLPCFLHAFCINPLAHQSFFGGCKNAAFAPRGGPPDARLVVPVACPTRGQAHGASGREQHVPPTEKHANSHFCISALQIIIS